MPSRCGAARSNRQINCSWVEVPKTAAPSEIQPELDETEQHEAEERTAVSAKVVHEAVRLSGVEEIHRPASALAWSGLAAGLSMGFHWWARDCCALPCPTLPGGRS